MRLHAYYKRDDGSLDMTNPVIVDSNNIPEYLFLAEEGKVYNSEGYEIDLPEPVPQGPTELELLMLAVAELDMQRELDRTENQVAIAELAESLIGGI